MRYSPGMAQFYDGAPWPDDAQDLTADQVAAIECCLQHGGSLDTSAGGIRPLWPAEALAALRAQQVDAITAARESARESAVVVYKGNRYQADPASQANITSVVVAASAGVPLPAGFAWRTADNQNVPCGLADLVAIGGAALAITNALYQRSWARKAAIASAADADAILAVVW